MASEGATWALLWQPLHLALASRVALGDGLSFVVSPFIKLDALAQLLGLGAWAQDIKFVVRWRSEDLVSGVSDLDVYPFLRERGVRLYASPRLHMKLYVYESNWALATSANLTRRGLGFAEDHTCNIETGCEISLQRNDWMMLHQLVEESRLVTDDVYARMRDFVSQHCRQASTLPSFDPFGPRKLFSLASLPATGSPAQLEAFYFSVPGFHTSAEFERRAFQDLATYRIRPGLPLEQFRADLIVSFVNSPFVRAFLEHLRAKGSLRFGEITAWIHQRCEDAPLPYRSDIKDHVARLYEWLGQCIPEIRITRPNYSQVMHWRDEL